MVLLWDRRNVKAAECYTLLPNWQDGSCLQSLITCVLLSFGANAFLPVAKTQHIQLPQSSFPACLLPQQHLPLLTACSLMSYRISAPEGPCLSKGEMNKNTKKTKKQNIHTLLNGLQQTDTRT